MKRCIVTTLQDTADNNTLRKYGVLRLTAKNVEDGNSSWIKIWGNDGGHVSVSGGTAYAEAARTTSLGSEFDITSDAFSFWLSDGNTEIEVKDVYKITKISLGSRVSVNIDDVCCNTDGLVIEGYKDTGSSALFIGNVDTLEDRDAGSVIVKKLQQGTCIVLTGVSGNVKNLNKFGFDLNGFSGMTVQFYTLPDSTNTPSDIHGNISVFEGFNSDWKTKLIEIKTQRGSVGKLYGNIEAFKDYINMESFNLNEIKVTGNLSTALGRMINLSLIGLGGHTEAFDLANLFDTLYNNGKTSGSIVCWVGSNKTVNGNPWINGGSVTFTINGWTVN